MKRPVIISAGLLLFLFGLAIAKAGDSEQKMQLKQLRAPAKASELTSL